ncbi:D-beta-hydroxybutyrate dehydrogenase, mitochondrial-like [Mytilus edulis]|uniref:D-beta-hydroxybutyrate dehydrogenase, mitochondrial-like n=1 Tax=Mytilus edulis TaxID=6550 RepID=UPI0039EEE891
MDITLICRALFTTSVLLCIIIVCYENYITLICFGIFYLTFKVTERKFKDVLPVNKKAVLITGCDTGFGHDLAYRLVDDGFIVFAGVLNYNGKGACELRNRNLRNLNVVQLDLTKSNEIDKLVAIVSEQCSAKGLWAVVNNAGIGIGGDIELCNLQQYRHIMDINLLGHMTIIKACLPLLRRCKGRIVNVSSVRGRFSWPGYSTYHVSKAGLETMSDSLRLEMVKFGIKVSIVEPGWFPLATASMSIETCERVKKDCEEQWKEASEEIKRLYGRKYFFAWYDEMLVNRNDTRAASSSEPVIDALVDALRNVHPKYRYLVDGGQGFNIDTRARLAACYNFLQDFVSDPYLMWASGYKYRRLGE